MYDTLFKKKSRKVPGTASSVNKTFTDFCIKRECTPGSCRRIPLLFRRCPIYFERVEDTEGICTSPEISGVLTVPGGEFVDL